MEILELVTNTPHLKPFSGRYWRPTKVQQICKWWRIHLISKKAYNSICSDACKTAGWAIMWLTPWPKQTKQDKHLYDITNKHWNQYTFVKFPPLWSESMMKNVFQLMIKVSNICGRDSISQKKTGYFDRNYKPSWHVKTTKMLNMWLKFWFFNYQIPHEDETWKYKTSHMFPAVWTPFQMLFR